MTAHIGFRHFRHSRPSFVADKGFEHSTKGGVTMAFAADKHIGDLTASDTVKVEFAFCSGQDNFQRMVGRAISLRRLTNNPLLIPGDVFVKVIHAVNPLKLPHILQNVFDEHTLAEFAALVVNSIGTC